MLTNKQSYRKNNLRDIQKVFNDGICELFTASERVITQSKGKFYFARESVGIGHYFQAYNNNISVDESISVPVNQITIDSQDVVKIGNDWYEIVRIQYHDNKRPHYWTLSLAKARFSYEVSNNEND